MQWLAISSHDTLLGDAARSKTVNEGSEIAPKIGAGRNRDEITGFIGAAVMELTSDD